jgi:arylsulfatase A
MKFFTSVKCNSSIMNNLYLKILLFLALGACQRTPVHRITSPNVVIIFLDDAGWGDFRPFSQPRYPTPNIDRLAAEGRSFMNFYVPQSVCSASRASLLTGCYPEHVGIAGALSPGQRGLSPDYITLGEALQQQNYKTACFGKWHLGDHPDTHPYSQGFDETAGIMYSNDMWAGHPTNPEFWGKFPLKFYENKNTVIDSVTDEHQKLFTTWITEKSVDFIERHKSRPFFLYVAHPMPHVPLFCSEKFEGKSGTGLYGDVMMELDWSIGQIIGALKQNGLNNNTIVIFTSDNGPWTSFGNHAGQTPFREAKATSFDGGTRSPLIIKYPDNIKANTISFSTFMSIDLYPTICQLTGTQLPDYNIDGKNVWDIIVDKPGAQHPHDYYFFSTGSLNEGNKFEAMITSDGKWKLHLPHGYRTVIKGNIDGMSGTYQQDKIDTSLYDMVHDPYERINVYGRYPEIESKMLEQVELHRNKYYSND